MTTRRVSVAEGKQTLPQLLREVERDGSTILIYRRDHLAGALMAPEVFRRLLRLQAYADALRLSEELAHLDVNAVDLARDARADLEGRS